MVSRLWVCTGSFGKAANIITPLLYFGVDPGFSIILVAKVASKISLLVWMVLMVPSKYFCEPGSGCCAQVVNFSGFWYSIQVWGRGCKESEELSLDQQISAYSCIISVPGLERLRELIE